MLKRTNFVVIDLKYILTIPPTTWTDGLIKNFNRGMDYFLQLLCNMQVGKMQSFFASLINSS